MRIAVSGSHSVGKSTVVADFKNAHGEYIREEEPYRALCEFYPIKFGKASTRYCNGIQLYYNISRVLSYQTEAEAVIFDRSPVDYIAYSLYTANYHETDIDDGFVEGMIEPVRAVLQNIDLLVYVPISERHPVELEDDGIRLTDQAYRTEVDDIFKRIYREALFDVMPRQNAPTLIEVWGPREQRLEQTRSYLK